MGGIVEQLTDAMEARISWMQFVLSQSFDNIFSFASVFSTHGEVKAASDPGIIHNKISSLPAFVLAVSVRHRTSCAFVHALVCD